MKIFLCTILFLMFSACCLTGNKCDGDHTMIDFKIVDSKTAKDLVFGSSRIYYADSIQFFSVSGKDTVYHLYRAQLSSNLGTDSLLFVDVNVENNALVFMRLNNSDIDTLRFTYVMNDGGKCCGDSKSLKTFQHNNNSVKTINGLSTIQK